jgi:hypothetical protein
LHSKNTKEKHHKKIKVKTFLKIKNYSKVIEKKENYLDLGLSPPSYTNS